MPPKKQPTLYDVEKTHMWFAITSMVLLASLIWMVMADYNRDWKGWQKQFVQEKKQILQKKFDALPVDEAKIKQLQESLSGAQGALLGHKTQLDKLEKEYQSLALSRVKINQKYQDQKQYHDSYRYYFEEARHKGDKEQAESYQKQMKDLVPGINQMEVDLQVLDEKMEAVEAEKQGIYALRDDVQAKITAITKEGDSLKKQIKKLGFNPANLLLDAPMLDFMAPSLKVQQVVLEDLFDDYHYAKVAKVDRCTTCHLGIDQAGFEDAPQPFKSHPKLDLYLSAESPHALEKIGCTVCHSGSGHSVDFTYSAHTPQNEEQGQEWKEKYNWHRLEKWEKPMLPMQNIEASCVKCHRSVVEVPGAESLNKGRDLARLYGCLGCHKIGEMEESWKAGPSLMSVKSKLSEEWIKKWLHDPKSFRHSTKMPRMFHLENIETAEDHARAEAEIASIARYLLSHSKETSLKATSVTGDESNGQQLIEKIGCLGCHTSNGMSFNDYGPELTHLGSKVTKEWLFDWLKDPKHYSPEARMPNMRLSDQEAMDIAAYLLSQKNLEFEAIEETEISEDILDGLVMDYLTRSMSRTQAQTRKTEMDLAEKLNFVGEKTIGFRGCYACHDIAGFEDAKQIGTELSNHGNKNIHQLDFGFSHIEHTREAWFARKLDRPQSFDEGKEKSYFEKLRMPHFGFSDEEIGYLTTFLLSLTTDEIPMERQRLLSESDVMMEKGRYLIARSNCYGCHSIDGKEGNIQAYYPEKGNAPPTLEGEGAKVQEPWLHSFLEEPETIRPWLDVRMPTFGFNDAEAEALVYYFTHAAEKSPSYLGYPAPEATDEELASGQKLFEAFQCMKCHQTGDAAAKLGASFRAPDLAIAKDRLQPKWVEDWLADPSALQDGTKMPAFWPDGQAYLTDVLDGDATRQMAAVTAYLFRYPMPEKEVEKKVEPTPEPAS